MFENGFAVLLFGVLFMCNKAREKGCFSCESYSVRNCKGHYCDMVFRQCLD